MYLILISVADLAIGFKLRKCFSTIRIIIPLSLSISVLTTQAYADRLNPQETFTLLFELSDIIHCSITIQPEIIEGTYLNHPDHDLTKNVEDTVSKLNWSFVPPAKIYDDDCERTPYMNFHEGNPIIIHAHSDWQEIQSGTPHYFFYIRKDMDTGPDYKYQISWNGSLQWSHAQWHITDSARLEKRGSEHCLIDEKITLCFR